MCKTSSISVCRCGGTAACVASLLLLSVWARACCGQGFPESGDSTQDAIFARSGDIVTLPCNQSLPPSSPSLPFVPFFLQWHRQDLPFAFYIGFSNYPPYVDPQYASRVTVLGDLSLQIDGVVVEDDGWYECQVIVLSGNYDNLGNGTFVQLVIIGPPRFLATPPALVVFHEDKPERLQCVAKGTPTPTVTWLKDGQPITSDHIRMTTNAIEFDGVRQGDSGTYTCRAASEEGEVQHTVRVLVHGAPFIFIPPHNLTVISDEVAVLECEAEASPDNVTQRWYHRGDLIADSGRFEFLPEGGLAVQGVQPEDEGWYSCSPTNGLGEAPIARAYLDVQYPAFVVSMPANAYVARGLDVTLSCTSDADPPLLNVRWYRSGSEIIVRRSNRYSISDEGSLTIVAAELEDSGPYTCTPYNKIGTAGESPATVLVVRDPPAFVARPEPQYQRLLGEEITAPCRAVGDPVPTITWQKVRGKLPQFRSIVSQSSLTIRGLTKEDHGMYKCLATNEIATIVSTMRLIVELTSPHEPHNVTVVTTISSARIAWQPAYNGGFTQTYTVWSRHVEGTDDHWSKSDPIPEEVTFFVVQGLDPGTEYQFAVTASNQAGDSLFSEIVSARTKDPSDTVSPTDETGRTLIPIYIGLTPSPPQNLTISPTLEGLLLAWQPPAVWGQFVDRYSVEYRLQGPWVVLYDRVDGGETQRVLGGLQPNTTYQFRMFAFTPLLFSAPSRVVTGYTGDIPAYIPPRPTTDRTPQYGETGILAGVVAAICFLLVALLLSILAICISYRRKQKKNRRMALFSVAAQTPQPLIHRPPPTQSPETPMPAPVKPIGLVSKLIVKISPKHQSDPAASAPHPGRRAHLTSNGKLPNSHSEPSLSERLLGRPSSHRLAGAHKEGAGELSSRRWSGSGGSSSRPRRLASEQALELEEFEPAAAGVYSVRDGRIRTHGLYSYNSSCPHNSGGAYSETDLASRDDDDSDAAPDTLNNIPPGLRPLNSELSRPLRGDYVYYHGNMFITSNSDDNEDYGWPSDVEPYREEDNGGLVNPALVADDSGVPASRRSPPAQNHYVDMPKKNDWRWDREWADDTLSHTHHNAPQAQNSVYRHGTLPRQSTKKDVRRLSRDDFRGGPPAEYHSSPPWSDSISTIQGNSISARHPDYTSVDNGDSYRTRRDRGLDDYEYRGHHVSRRSPERQASPQRRPDSPDYEKLRTFPRGRESSQKHEGDSNYGEPVASWTPERQPSPHRQVSHQVYGEPRATKQSTSPYYHDSDYTTYDRTNVPKGRKEDLYDYNTGTKSRKSDRDRKSPPEADIGGEPERYRKPMQQVMKRSPVRSAQGPKGWTDPTAYPRAGQSGATAAESYSDADTLQATLRDTDPTITSDHDNGRHPNNGTASPAEGARQKQDMSGSPRAASLDNGRRPKIYERSSPQGGIQPKIYDDIGIVELSVRPKRSSLSPSYDRLHSPPRGSRDQNYNTIPRRFTEDAVETSRSPTLGANSRASVSSVDSRPGSTKPLPLPQAYLSAHQRSLLSPNSQYSASSGYASRNTSQSTASRGRTSSVPSIHDPTLSTSTADGVESPFSDSAGPFSNVSSKESEEPYFEFDPMLHETDLLDALKKYYQPVEVSVPEDKTYDEGTGKVADMEKRCEELKKEFQEYQRQQAKAKQRRSRVTSSV